jgi:hypothetical protein
VQQQRQEQLQQEQQDQYQDMAAANEPLTLAVQGGGHGAKHTRPATVAAVSQTHPGKRRPRGRQSREDSGSGRGVKRARVVLATSPAAALTGTADGEGAASLRPHQHVTGSPAPAAAPVNLPDEFNELWPQLSVNGLSSVEADELRSLLLLHVMSAVAASQAGGPTNRSGQRIELEIACEPANLLSLRVGRNMLWLPADLSPHDMNLSSWATSYRCSLLLEESGQGRYRVSFSGGRQLLLCHSPAVASFVPDELPQTPLNSGGG